LFRFTKYNGSNIPGLSPNREKGTRINMGETVLSFLLGIGLSAAVGFRVFVPMLLMSLASMAGWITLAPGFQWMGTPGHWCLPWHPVGCLAFWCPG
jgi:hypothetical protein